MNSYRALVLGASAGGVEALLHLLPRLDGLDLPILLVQHLPQDVPSHLAEIFAARLQRPVREAEDKEPLQPSTLYVAPPGYHLCVETDFSLSLSREAAVNFSRPSIDLLFESAAAVFGRQLIGALLTGANEDGAAGLRRIAERGGLTLVQDPQEAVCPAMPQAALKLFTPAHVLSLDAMADFLLRLE